MKGFMKKIFCIALVAMMSFSITACGNKNEDPTAGEHHLNIWCWNDEFQSRFNKFYPEVKEVSEDGSTTILKDGTIVNWIINENDHNNYQNKLDEALLAQDSVYDNEKIDIFLVEADYASKYVNSRNTLDIKEDIGLTNEDLANQYQYTKEIATDKYGSQKGTAWQATPGLFAYRRSIARDVLGTDDPEQVQQALSDWNKFDAVAALAHEKGYKMLSGYDDSYRAFSNNVSGPWVSGDKVIVDPQIMKWIEQSKRYTDAGYNNKTSLWDEDWTSDQGPDGKVFGFFYSTWGINFTLLENSLADADGPKKVGNGSYGDWAVCYGPDSYYWGGTWICAADGTDDKELIKDIMLKLTCDKEIMESITRDPEVQDYTNNMAAMNEIANDENYSSEFLGGQNHVALFAEAAQQIDMSNAGAYDQGCNEELQTVFADYFAGDIDLEDAKANYEKIIKEKYPDIKTVEWPR